MHNFIHEWSNPESISFGNAMNGLMHDPKPKTDRDLALDCCQFRELCMAYQILPSTSVAIAKAHNPKRITDIKSPLIFH